MDELSTTLTQQVEDAQAAEKNAVADAMHSAAELKKLKAKVAALQSQVKELQDQQVGGQEEQEQENSAEDAAARQRRAQDAAGSIKRAFDVRQGLHDGASKHGNIVN